MMIFDKLKQFVKGLLTGQNLDAALALVAALTAAVLGPLGFVSPQVQSSLLLAILAMLAIATLVDRAKIDHLTALLAKNRGAPSFVHEFDDGEFNRDVAIAQELWVVGASLGGFVNPRFAQLEQMVREGLTIRVLVINPEATEILQISEQRAYGNPSVSRAASKARATIDDFLSMRKRTSGSIAIRVLNYPIPHRIVAINPNSRNGKIYVSEYLFQTPGGTIPKFVLDRTTREWLDLYKHEAENLWNAAEEVN